ncbi:hypothetical protein BGZ97_006442 [Linnemannia gamsii]|uniref:Uncharacterized protein n=1 Tax=Linnemannia gamsii TaxID=64522 RepID=A0A9P6UFU2_9FUNG|nr:hypothetical protein BGZ97_006442 [Linnemannia gamsii]
MPTPERSLTSGGSSVYKPIIYFAETRTVRHMHELCRSEATFQQQLAQNPRTITTVLLDPPHLKGKQVWTHPVTDDAYVANDDTPLQSHKAVFAPSNRGARNSCNGVHVDRVRQQHSSGCIGGGTSDRWSAISIDSNPAIYSNVSDGSDYTYNNVCLECTSLEKKLYARKELEC